MICKNCGGEWCESCGVCHSCLTDQAKPKTQKLKGIVALSDWGALNVPPVKAVLSVSEPFPEKPTGPLTWPLFARPCPLIPCHGFVESRKVNNWEEVKQVWEETKAADPNGEVILMPLIKASHNAVLVPSLLTVGEGHDGATSGKNTITFPLAKLEAFPKSVLQAAGIGPEQDPYLELVQGSWPLATQLRAGPKLTSPNPDFVPAKMTVEEVIQPAGEDLLDWAKRIQGLAPGTVVWHPGGSLTDHYSVHCRESGVPILITFKPTVGQVLEPITKLDPDPEAVLKGALAADSVKWTDLPAAARLMLLSLHNSQAMAGVHGAWIGAATVIMLKLGSLALRGEARHYKRIKLGQHVPDRSAIYRRYQHHSIRFHRAGLRRYANLFKFGEWGGSFGGLRWATCAFALKPLFDALMELARTPNPVTVSELVKALNVAVNQAHNGGWWLNKFINQQAFVQAQSGSLVQIIDSFRLIYEQGKLLSTADPSVMERKLDKWTKLPPLDMAPPVIQGAEMSIVPNTGAIAIQLKARAFGKGGGYTKQIQVPFAKFGSKVLERLGKVVLVGGPRLKVECRVEGEEPLLLWEEPEIDVTKGINQ